MSSSEPPGTGLRSVVYFRRFLDRCGGSERLALEWLSWLERRGVQTTFLTYRHRPQDVFDGRYRCRVEALGEAAPFPARVWRLRRRLVQLAPDVVLVEGDGDHVVDVYLACLLSRRRYVALMHGSIFTFDPEREATRHALVFRRAAREIRSSLPGYAELAPAGRPAMGLGRRVLVEGYALVKYLAVRRAASLLALTERNRWEVARLYGRGALVLRGAFPQALLDHRPGSDARRRLGLRDEKVVLTVCRLVRSKRVDLCLRAFAVLAAQRPDAVMLVGGTGPERERLEALARGLGLAGRLRFLGHVPDAGLWDLIACCDVFLHMDLAFFDLAPLEALALGRKVVWPAEMEPGGALGGDPAVFAAAPDEADAARALSAALDAPAPPLDRARKERLAACCWEDYFSRATAALDAPAPNESSKLPAAKSYDIVGGSKG